jgi:hypothetical protein
MNPTDDDEMMAELAADPEFLAWCDARKAEALAFQMEHEEEEPEEG